MSQKIRLALSLFCLFSLFTFASDAYAVVVPDVVGLSQAQAQAAITDAELFSGNITFQFNDSHPNGIVFDQDPNALETVSTGSYVSLNVSLGPWPCHVPDLYGLSQTEAETAIIDAGLAIGDISYRLEEPNSPTDFVISQSPKADTGVAFDTEVNFTIIITEFNLLLGSGTEYDPYLIQNLDDFDIFADSAYSSALWTTGVHTQLACNLDLSGRTYNGAVIASNMEYSGIFDGGGFYISNLVSYVGLFGKISSTGIVENLYCADFEIKGYYYCGTVCGSNYGTIINCSASGSVTGDESLGGLCGYNDGTVSYCAANCMIAGDDNLGGLCGSNRGAISNCSAFGTVTGGYDSDYLGGLCGYNDYGTITNCYATGSVTGGNDSDSLGGLCGRNYYGTIVNCYASGDVSGGNDSDRLGGLCGENNDGDIISCYSTGSVSGDGYLGGLCGYNSYGTISKCYSTGSVSGNDNLGGLCGYQSGYRAKLLNSFWDTQTSGTTNGYNYSSGSVTNVLGKTTAEMQDINIFLAAGWDFIGETANGSDDIWTMAGYPTFSQDISTYWGVVPDLTGLTQNDAIWDIFDAGLLVGYIYYSDEYNVEPDYVITQSPAPGLPGCRVDLLISLGFRPRVPDIIGLPEADARNEIINAELSVGDISYQFDIVPYGYIISQSPDPSVKVTPDTPVDFVVSLGAPFIVPDLSYMTQAEAESAILNAGLPVGKISYKYNNDIPNGLVISQSPAFGTFAHTESPVYITVSLGHYEPLAGSGTEADPFLIQSIDEFDKIADPNNYLYFDPNCCPDYYPDYLAEDVHIKLMVDIDLAGRTYTTALISHDPISNNNYSYDGISYFGTLNGNGHTISNINIDTSNTSNDYLGLFGSIGKSGKVFNLNISVNIISGRYSVYTGGICALNLGTIENCHVSGNITNYKYDYIVKEKDSTGGICGVNDHGGNIISCSSLISIKGDSYFFGGLAGYSNGTISNCYAASSVSGDDYLGGLCGYNDNGTIANSYATGSVSGDDYLGGLCGYNYSGTITNCYAASSVSGGDSSYYLGGLCGFNNEGTITNCYATGSVSGGDSSYYLGGLCGISYSGNFSNCFYYNFGGPENRYGIPLEDNQLQDKSCFIGFDFAGDASDGSDDIWSIEPGHMPRLYWQSSPGFFPPYLLNNISTTLSGTGYPDDPFIISNFDDMIEFRTNTSLRIGYYSLQDNIDLSGTIYPNAFIPEYFFGHFDGNGFSIYNLSINGSSYLGLFAKISGPVSNVNIENVNIFTSGDYCGGLCGNSYYGTFSNCYATGSVSGNDRLGGLCGENYRGTISNCYAACSVSGGDYSYSLGGLCGENYRGTISNCYAACSVSGGDYSYSLGGLCGENYNGTITNCYAASSVSGNRYLGGLCGYNDNGTISNCYSTGSVTGGDGSRYLGGLCGRNLVGTISNCYATGSVSGDDSSYSLGGLCGYNYFGTITNCYASGSVSGGDSSYYLGGLCGYNYYGTISNCYATGSVTGGNDSDSLGGLCGYNISGTITNCYATGSVSGGSRLGGLCGYQYGSSALIQNSFWDTQTSDRGSVGSNNYGATGLSTTQMQDIDTFLDAGWDFVSEPDNGTDDLWHMPYQSTGYPMLYWQRDIPGDLTGTYGVDIADFAAISDSWLIDYNLSDLEILTNFWLEQ